MDAILGYAGTIDTRRLAITVALSTFVCAIALIAVMRPSTSSSERLNGAEALHNALQDREVVRYLAAHRYTRHRTLAIDQRLELVSFLDGRRVVLDAAVAPDGTVVKTIKYRAGYLRAGSPVPQTPVAVIALSLVFALMAVRLPLLSYRNLDVLALASFATVIVLLNERLFEWSVYAGFPPLVYLVGRCVAVAFAKPKESRSRQSTPLFDVLTRRLEPDVKSRLLGGVCATAAVVLLLISIPGGVVVDVGYASMAGATRLLHGGLPYGHLPSDVLHGDTYPLLAYVLYIPAAVIAPVEDGFDNLDGALWVTALAALVVAAALYVAVTRVEHRRSAGMRIAVAWLVFLPVLVGTSSGSNDLVAAAFVAIALAMAAHSTRSTLLLTVAGWVKLVPLFCLPLWVARLRGPAIARAIAAIAVVTAFVVAWLLLLDGTAAVADMMEGISFQGERGSPLSIWTVISVPALQVAFQAAVLSLVALSAFLTWRDRALAGDLSRVAALAGAIVLGFQLAGNYWTPVYLVWAFPFLAIALLCDRRSETGEPAATAG